MKAAYLDKDISAFVPVDDGYEDVVDYMTKQLEIVLLARAKERLWGAPDHDF